MNGRGFVLRGGLFLVFPLTVLFALTVGATMIQQGLLPVFSSYDNDIRGVIVVFARDHQLQSVLCAMNQFQAAHAYSSHQASEDRLLAEPLFSAKDWIFYSDEAVSDEFKILTSNLTLPGTAYYEIWDQNDMTNNIWNLPALPHHPRLQHYNWAWTITPGTAFHMDNGFDGIDTAPTPSSPSNLSVFRSCPISSSALNGIFYLLGDPDEDLSAVHKRWAILAEDFYEQQKMPGLNSGFTSLYWSAKVYTVGGRRARAWLFREDDPIHDNKTSSSQEGNSSDHGRGDDNLLRHKDEK